MNVTTTRPYKHGHHDGRVGNAFGHNATHTQQGIDSALYLAGFNAARGVPPKNGMSQFEKEYFERVKD
jgi:hypothetical protein